MAHIQKIVSIILKDAFQFLYEIALNIVTVINLSINFRQLSMKSITIPFCLFLIELKLLETEGHCLCLSLWLVIRSH